MRAGLFSVLFRRTWIPFHCSSICITFQCWCFCYAWTEGSDKFPRFGFEHIFKDPVSCPHTNAWVKEKMLDFLHCCRSKKPQSVRVQHAAVYSRGLLWSVRDRCPLVSAPEGSSRTFLATVSVVTCSPRVDYEVKTKQLVPSLPCVCSCAVRAPGLLSTPILVQSRYQQHVWEGGREKYPAIL